MDIAPIAVGRGLAGMLAAAVYSAAGECGLVEEAVRECASVGLTLYVQVAQAFLAFAQQKSGRTLEAIESSRALLEGTDGLTAHIARMILALALVDAGDLDAAEQEAKMLLEQGSMFSGLCAGALGVLSLVVATRPGGRGPRTCRSGPRGVQEHGARGFQIESPRALALRARSDGRSALRSPSRATGSHAAATFEDPDLRRSYLTKVTINARILEMADNLLGNVPASPG